MNLNFEFDLVFIVVNYSLKIGTILFNNYDRGKA